jgi:hypothetical protein
MSGTQRVDLQPRNMAEARLSIIVILLVVVLVVVLLVVISLGG